MVWIKQNVKTVVTALVLVTIFSAFSAVCVKQLKHQRQKSNALEQTISDLNQEIKQSRITLNDSISVYQAEVRNLNFTKANLKAKYDDLLKASKIAPKDVNSFVGISTQVMRVDTVEALIDTFGGIKSQICDKFVKIDVEITPERKAIIDYWMKDSLSVIVTQKKHSILFGLIRWKSYESTKVINHNPTAVISGLESISIIE